MGKDFGKGFWIDRILVYFRERERNGGETIHRNGSLCVLECNVFLLLFREKVHFGPLTIFFNLQVYFIKTSLTILAHTWLFIRPFPFKILIFIFLTKVLFVLDAKR